MTGFRLLAEYDVPLDEIDEPSLSEFSEYWHTKAGDRGFVTRDDISPADLIGGLGLIRIAMIEPDGGFRFRLYGSKATNPDQVDMTGKTTKDYADRAFAALVERHYGMVAADGVGRCWHVVGLVDAGRYEYQRVVLPLSYSGAEMDALIIKSARIKNEALRWKI
ncbi:MAG: PAS domain-containing protein [Alphaproteobacteria bacterium]|nr:PAS domain-containing protein [Alphaproteobacteria bacterium]